MTTGPAPTPTSIPTPEFSVVIDLEALPDDGKTFKLAADADARAALARRFDLQSIGRFEAELKIVWLKRGKVLSVRGFLSADVVQTCVVTLDPVAAQVDETLDIVFARDIDSAAEMVDPAEAEPLEGNTLDIGEFVSEELSLALDPYPRAPGIDPKSLNLGPGARFLTEDEAEREGREGHRPFERLAGLKPKL